MYFFKKGPIKVDPALELNGLLQKILIEIANNAKKKCKFQLILTKLR